MDHGSEGLGCRRGYQPGREVVVGVGLDNDGVALALLLVSLSGARSLEAVDVTTHGVRPVLRGPRGFLPGIRGWLPAVRRRRASLPGACCARRFRERVGWRGWGWCRLP